ncbi:MAG: bifunctional hydroxymethylpyrimidine kinase/phosphomethylpyrimidine kinase [Sedimentisphaerales bacterium]|nr:bifunctional hydroxymethylpyrimidine kinase/phosphomethylpyrimidine kinase [Sedimentisphaerales bacterium]
MSLLVTGSIGIDTVRTPVGESKDCLGGSAIYFSMAASFFAPVRLVGVIGEDCPFVLENVFAGKDVDLAGLEIRQGSKTFRWSGTYFGDMNQRTTDACELNVLAEDPPKVPDVYRDSEYVFLANTTPALQIELLEQVDSPKFVAADTMNLWINEYKDDLKKLLDKIDCLVLNDEEAILLSGDENLILAADSITKMGPKVVIVKKGQHGSLTAVADGDKFILPAYPAEKVIDPTGAGDSFAGGFMGYLVKENKTDTATLKKAVAYGTVVASFTIADFSLQGLTKTNRGDIDNRLAELRKVVKF